MTRMVRRAGRATLADGSQVIWSVADGRRGRRWRAVTSRDGAQTGSLLLETSLDGRPSRLEFASAAGLLTLHPEPTGFLHGNAVTPEGVRHVAIPWSDRHGLEIDGQPFANAVTARWLAGSTAVGEGRTVPVVAVAVDLVVRQASRRYTRLGNLTWRIEGAGDSSESSTLTIDERGIPAWPGEAGEWPLESESPA